MSADADASHGLEPSRSDRSRRSGVDRTSPASEGDDARSHASSYVLDSLSAAPAGSLSAADADTGGPALGESAASARKHRHAPMVRTEPWNSRPRKGSKRRRRKRSVEAASTLSATDVAVHLRSASFRTGGGASPVPAPPAAPQPALGLSAPAVQASAITSASSTQVYPPAPISGVVSAGQGGTVPSPHLSHASGAASLQSGSRSQRSRVSQRSQTSGGAGASNTEQLMFVDVASDAGRSPIRAAAPPQPVNGARLSGAVGSSVSDVPELKSVRRLTTVGSVISGLGDPVEDWRRYPRVDFRRSHTMPEQGSVSSRHLYQEPPGVSRDLRSAALRSYASRLSSVYGGGDDGESPGDSAGGSGGDSSDTATKASTAVGRTASSQGVSAYVTLPGKPTGDSHSSSGSSAFTSGLSSTASMPRLHKARSSHKAPRQGSRLCSRSTVTAGAAGVATLAVFACACVLWHLDLDRVKGDPAAGDVSALAVATCGALLLLAMAGAGLAARVVQRLSAQASMAPHQKRHQLHGRNGHDATRHLDGAPVHVGSEPLTGMDFVLRNLRHLKIATIDTPSITASLDRVMEVLRTSDLHSLRDPTSLKIVNFPDTVPEGWLAHGMYPNVLSSLSQLSPSVRRRTRMAMNDLGGTGLQQLTPTRSARGARMLEQDFGEARGGVHQAMDRFTHLVETPNGRGVGPFSRAHTIALDGQPVRAPGQRSPQHGPDLRAKFVSQQTSSSFSGEQSFTRPVALHFSEMGDLDRTLLRNADNFDVDMLQVARVTPRPLVASFIVALRSTNTVDTLSLKLDTLLEFIARINDGYMPTNSYHNAAHAASVVWDMQYFLRKTQLDTEARPLAKFAALVAAAVHDFMHPGVTNAFLVETSHPIAIVHNDSSVLERFHVGEAFGVAFEMNESSPFVDLAGSDYVELRQTIISMVLATDVSTHLQFLSVVRSSKYHYNAGPGGLGAEWVKEALKGAIILSDVGHAAKDFDVHASWSSVIRDEFFKQGDKERDLGIPLSPLCDRENADPLPESQIGFFTYVAHPLFHTLRKRMFGRTLSALSKQVTRNKRQWGKLGRVPAVDVHDSGTPSDSDRNVASASGDDVALERKASRADEATRLPARTTSMGAVGVGSKRNFARRLRSTVSGGVGGHAAHRASPAPAGGIRKFSFRGNGSGSARGSGRRMGGTGDTVAHTVVLDFAAPASPGPGPPVV